MISTNKYFYTLSRYLGIKFHSFEVQSNLLSIRDVFIQIHYLADSETVNSGDPYQVLSEHTNTANRHMSTLILIF